MIKRERETEKDRAWTVIKRERETEKDRAWTVIKRERLRKTEPGQ